MNDSKANNIPVGETREIVTCPYCKGTDIIKSGFRKKKLENIQVYYCNRCDKKFTPLITRQKKYPVAVILKALTYHNRFLSLEEISENIQNEYGLKLVPNTIINWIKSYEDYLPFLRMREFLTNKIRQKEAKASDFIVENRLFHGQIYDFKYHRAKTDLILNEEFRHYKFKKLQEFLELVTAECPHQVFKESKNRASEYKDCFNLDGIKISPKTNTATKTANFVIQAISNNKLRHEVLQEFILVNDSVTIATEVPVLLDKDDILHYQNSLNFIVPITLEDEEIITGHIDFIQIRNGMIHILDYKPSARKVKPVDQLTIYALALSRLTTLRLYHFKCAWFDSENYFEFYPLHVVYKKKSRSKKKNSMGKDK